MSIFVKAHRRGSAIVKAYMRSGRSMMKGSKALHKISSALNRVGTRYKVTRGHRGNFYKSSGYSNVLAAAKSASLPYQHGSAIMQAIVSQKRAYGNMVMKRVPGFNKKTAGTPMYSTRYRTGDMSKVVYGDRWERANARRFGIDVKGPVSAFPRGTKLDFKAMVDPRGVYHALKSPKKRKAYKYR